MMIPALNLKRSERSMPGLRAIPAEISTMSAPAGRARDQNQQTADGHAGRNMAQIDRHAPGHGSGIIEREFRSSFYNCIFSNRESDGPIPPAAPKTAIFIFSPDRSTIGHKNKPLGQSALDGSPVKILSECNMRDQPRQTG